ncbi:hypothetical protein NEUTE1DRAFT_135483 [Neurospora tetrasperma FGSC 2508]|uniref:Uncharacterized protein n=1 Tax=Neurospora tetrasperma (strain FGSC 2508 / ATCC MYA-4615 / P0657) TaxID=510951 RepID=F8ME17_NEUT8|nr:uncharacterized protein NEUTE1DRAFT_135483 [Neurospora tetrasperma FGSC 2508]EGO61552.1 hypothetical protein NEUTE1DRAFT_135483 [Neurospora tetrasperma FGSC 2508]
MSKSHHFVLSVRAAASYIVVLIDSCPTGLDFPPSRARGRHPYSLLRASGRLRAGFESTYKPHHHRITLQPVVRSPSLRA